MNWSQQINEIANWQLVTGNTGAPPKAVNARLASWVRWAIREARANQALAKEIAALGIAPDRPKNTQRRRALVVAKQLGLRDAGWASSLENLQ